MKVKSLHIEWSFKEVCLVKNINRLNTDQLQMFSVQLNICFYEKLELKKKSFLKNTTF